MIVAKEPLAESPDIDIKGQLVTDTVANVYAHQCVRDQWSPTTALIALHNTLYSSRRTMNELVRVRSSIIAVIDHCCGIGGAGAMANDKLDLV